MDRLPSRKARTLLRVQGTVLAATGVALVGLELVVAAAGLAEDSGALARLARGVLLVAVLAVLVTGVPALLAFLLAARLPGARTGTLAFEAVLGCLGLLALGGALLAAGGTGVAVVAILLVNGATHTIAAPAVLRLLTAR